MKGFGIYVKNSLLDPKHVVDMGASVWLYMWLLDAMTSVTEEGIGAVLGGKPITYKEVGKDVGFTHTTYVRYITNLRKHGYINTVRTPAGLVITVNKAEKIFKSKVPVDKKSDVSKMDFTRQKSGSDVSKMDCDVSKMDFQYKTIQGQYNNNITNVMGGDAHGNTEINDLFTYWHERTGLSIQSRVVKNRRACQNLLKRHGVTGVRRLIDGAARAQGERFAPRISSFEDLQEKLDRLLVWGRQQRNQEIEVIS